MLKFFGTRPLQIIILLLLACGPLNRVQQLNQQSRALATGVAVIGEGDYLALDAYKKLDQLPGYRLESRLIIRDTGDTRSVFTSISNHDAQGNVHTLTQLPDGQQAESYVIDGHTYVYGSQYDGWVDLTAAGTLTETQTIQPNSPVSSVNQMEQTLQLLAQFGAVPTKSGQETLQGRAVTRYKLDYIAADLAQAFGNTADKVTLDLQGQLWIDDQTGALLKSEILFYETEAQHPKQEMFLEVTQIGDILPIAAPSPIVNPAEIIAATATAQAWSVQHVELDYQGTPITFELIPLEASQAENTPTAHMRLMLRQLPADILIATNTEPFLTLLEQRLTMSIPQKNLVAGSNGFQIIDIAPQTQSVEVIYFFEVELGNFSHVELMVANPGNPLLATVPVVNQD